MSDCPYNVHTSVFQVLISIKLVCIILKKCPRKSYRV